MKVIEKISLKDIASYLPSLVPLAVVSIFLIASTQLIYGHLNLKPKNQNVPASKYNNSLISWHLSSAGYRESITTQTVTVSLTEEGDGNIELLTSSTEENAAPDVYFNIFSKVVSKNPYQIVIDWNPVRELNTSEVSKFKEILTANPGKFSIYAHKDHYKTAMKNFGQLANVRLSDFCAGSLYSICPYDAQWTFWNIIDLMSQFSDVDSNKITTRILHPVFDIFFLRQDKSTNVPDYSFSSIVADFDSINQDAFEDKIVFVGNDLTQGLRGMTHPLKIGKVPTYDTEHVSEARISGLSIHKFWASIARMFIDKDFTKISSPVLTNSIAITMGLISLSSSLVFGPFLALMTFILQFIFINMLTIILLKKFNFYIPVFKGLYLSSILFILGGFLRLIVESVREKHIQIKDKNISESTDIKGNFISLISHNLNTPVAKMISLMEHAKAELPRQSIDDYIAPSLLDASLIQLCFRCVLATNRLEENRINKEVLSSNKIIDEITFEVKPLLDRMGISLTYEDDSNYPEARFYFDRRILVPIISAISFMLKSPDEQGSKNFFLTIIYDNDENTLNLEWTTFNNEILIEKMSDKPDFTEQSCRTLLSSLISKTSSNISVTNEDEGNSVTLKVDCLSE